jgi:hypothetical protein
MKVYENMEVKSLSSHSYVSLSRCTVLFSHELGSWLGFRAILDEAVKRKIPSILAVK